MDQVLVSGSLNFLYGYRGLGKSFIVLDLAHRISLGLRWFSHECEQGSVVYVAAGEGAYGLGGRLRAWEAYTSERIREVAYITEPTMLVDDSDAKRFLRTLQNAALTPSLIVFDTLARCASGLDENTVEDMGKVIRAADLIRKETGSAVLFVHHSTKPDDEGKVRMRGSSALDSAADTVIALRQFEDHLLLICEKQKEAKEFHPIHVTLQERKGSAIPVRRG